jgi:hypothetical protein
MTLGELAAFVCSHVRSRGIRAVLSGGACVSLYTENKYQSFDLDFIENIPTTRNKLKQIMGEIGFMEEARYYKHPDTKFFVEFPPGPLTVGDEPAGKPYEIVFNTGTVTLLSPTDCVKDRLAGYFHWNDQQCLEQAVLVACNQSIDMSEIRRWSKNEEASDKFENFEASLSKNRPSQKNS